MSCVFEPLTMKPLPGCAKQDSFANIECNPGQEYLVEKSDTQGTMGIIIKI